MGAPDLATKRLVCSRRDGDLVLTVSIDDDQCRAGRHVTQSHEAIDVHALPAQRLSLGEPEFVVAHRADKGDCRTKSRRGDGLVRTLTTVVTGERAAGDRLTRRR